MTDTPRHQIDHILLIAVACLLVFGIIMLTSIGVPRSITLSSPDLLYPNCDLESVDCYFILKRHLLRVLAGLIFMGIAFKIHYNFWRKISLPAFIFAILALMFVLALGSTNNTFARSWINIWYGSLQPAEFAKLALIFYFAHWMERKSQDLASFRYGFLPFCVISLLVILPIFFQPDLGSSFVLATICVAIYFVAGARLRDLLFGALVAALVTSAIVLNVDYLKQRYYAFLHPGESCSQSYCWQSEQANIAVGSGGLWGRGLTQGIQKSQWLPQATDDFIFAASAEEIGFIRISLVVILYLIIAIRGFHIARHAPSKFSMLVSVGITSWIVAQAFLNIAVNISLFPITGITLPFVSYGGSSLTSTLIGVGVLLHISQYTTYHAYSPGRRRNRGSYLPKYSRFRNA